jgi:hypothetical protein
MNLDAHFTAEQLYRRLCRYRIARAQSRHDQHFPRNISKLAPAPALPSSFDQLFPPRDQWFRPTREERRGRDRADFNEQALYRTVIARVDAAAKNGEQWAAGLKALVALIRPRALAVNPTISTPTILPVEKSPHSYRAISSYPIPDRAIISETAQYLGRRFDEQFVGGVYSQRMGYATRSRSHHDAVEQLVSYRHTHAGERIFVAEVDLRSFFDCVPHELVRAAVARAVRHSRGAGMTIDPQALRILEAFLRSYSFVGTAVPGAAAWFSLHDPKGRLEIPTKELQKLWGTELPPNLGIPQGGALSGLIANLVLDPVDRAVLGAAGSPDPELFYARYVDDILIAHPDRSRCRAAFETLLKALYELRLPFHPPRQVRNYELKSKVTGRNLFWRYKSKAQYVWEEKGVTKHSVPWVGFLGYQVRYDGLLRIRPSSVAKQMSRQAGEVDRVLPLLCPKNADSTTKEFPTSALTSVICRLNAIVGTPTHGGAWGLGWASGFRLLRTNEHVTTQLQRLDQGRGRQIGRLIRALCAATGSSLPAGFLSRFRRYSLSYVAALAAPTGEGKAS